MSDEQQTLYCQAEAQFSVKFPCNEVGAKKYQLFNTDGSPDIKAFLCDNCVKNEIEKGWDWREVITPPTDKGE